MDSKPVAELTSWKEIADRLQVTVRTAQEWEKKRGMPVRRVPGGRGRVFIRVDELEAWLHQGESVSLGPANAADTADTQQPVTHYPPWLRPGRVAAAVAGAMIVTALVTAAILQSFQSRQGAANEAVAATVGSPSGSKNVRLTPRSITVVDGNGVELWDAEFDDPLKLPVYEQLRADGSPKAWRFFDTDADGLQEMLFVYRTAKHALSNPLICYDDNGEVLWAYSPDSPLMAVGGEYFEGIYKIANFETTRLPDGRQAVVVANIHYEMYPTQIAVLDATDGSVIAEYWHSGHIGHQDQGLLVADPNADGKPTIYAAGVSNAHDQATLVVLDVETMKGASWEESRSYQLEGHDASVGVTRVLFPQSSMSARLDDYNVADKVWLTSEFVHINVVEALFSETKPVLAYRLTLDLSTPAVSTTTTFESTHERMVQEGELTISLAEEKASLPRPRFIDDQSTRSSRR